jgi:superoxide reductase
MPKINLYQDINDIANEAKRDLIDRHSPFIKCEGTAKAGEPFAVTVQVGNEYTHPDDMDHYISSVALYNKETKLGEATMFAGALGGQGKKGHATVTFNIVLEKNAKLIAHAYCTKHGVWEGTPVEVTVS